MRTERVSFAYLISAFLIIVGLLTTYWAAFAMSGVVAAILMISSILGPDGAEPVGVREVESRSINEDGSVSVTLRVKNSGKGCLMEVREAVPDGVEVDGDIFTIRRIGKGEEITLEYTLHFPLKGTYRIGEVHIRAFDPFLFWIREFVIPIEDSIEVHVGTEDLRKIKLEPTRTKKWLGNINSRKIGIGTEFYSIREYMPGDSMRRINWKASARKGDLLVNEYEGENSGDAIIVLDAGERSLTGNQKSNTFKSGVRATLSIAAAMLRQRNRVGLVVLGDYLTWLYPEFGKRQLYRMMEAVSGIKKGGKWDFDELYWIITRLFPSNSFIVLISALQNPKIPDTIMKIRARGYDILIITPSPLAIEKRLGRLDREGELGLRVLSLERENIMDMLSEKVTVLDWDPAEPLGELLRGIRRNRR